MTQPDRRVRMMAACGELGLDTRVAARGAERLRAFASFITETARRVLSGDPRTALRQLVDDIEYADWLEKNSSSPAAAERRMANVQFLLDALLKQIYNNDSEDALEQPYPLHEYRSVNSCCRTCWNSATKRPTTTGYNC